MDAQAPDDFKKIDRDSHPMRANSYAPDILFKDTRRPPTVTLSEHNDNNAHMRAKQAELQRKHDAQYVEIDHNPVDDRRTKSVKIVGSEQKSCSHNTDDTSDQVQPSVRVQTPQSLERIRQIQEYKKGGSAKFPRDRTRSSTPRPVPAPKQTNTSSTSSMSDPSGLLDLEEEDDLMRASESPRRRAVQEQVDRQGRSEVNEQLHELSRQREINRMKVQVSVANHRIALRDVVTKTLCEAIANPGVHGMDVIKTLLCDEQARRFVSQLFEFEGLAGMPEGNGVLPGIGHGFGDHVFRH